MAFCLIPKKVIEFKKALRDRSIDPVKLAKMSSEQRRAFLEKFVGKENGLQVNSLFESKLLLKNQKAGYISWAKKTAGITTQAKRDLISRIERMDKVLNPAEEQAFLRDLAETRLGVNVSFEEAQKITGLSEKISELQKKTDITKSDIPLGRAKMNLTEYINSLGGKKADILTNVAGVPRSIMASLDLSAALNQGWGYASRKRFYTSLGSMFKSLKNEGYKNVQAEIITHPEYELAKRSGLRLTELGNKLELREEQFMSTLVDKIPGISASQRAYTGFLNKLRMDSFADLVKKAEVAGENVSMGSQATKDLASAVNDFTGGAMVGKVEGAVPILNAAFFSPRKIQSTIGMINPLNYINPKISKTARLERTRNLIGSLALSASFIALYGLLTGKKQETDPTSSSFGKIKSGDTRLDVSGGNSTYLIILSRLITQKIKGSSGISRKLSTKYGQTSGASLLGQFLRYKLSPNASLLVDAVTGASAIGEKKTIPQSVIDRFKPMFINSVVELLRSDTDGKFGFALAGLFGAGLNTYSSEVDWAEKTSEEMIQFKEQVGEAKFKEANNKFNQKYDDWYNKRTELPSFKNLSDKSKESVITKAKKIIQANILERYGFEYEKPEKDESETEAIEELLP